MKCSPKQFKMLHAIVADFARTYPGYTPVQWKELLVTIFPAFLAQADGLPLSVPPRRASTLSMDVERMSELIECCLWLGSEIGVVFSHIDK